MIGPRTGMLPPGVMLSGVMLLGVMLFSVMPGATSFADEAATPFSTPQHDVDVLYAIPVADPASGASIAPVAAVTQRLRVQAATGRSRIDPPSTGAFMLTDGRSGRTIVVEPSLRLATVLPQSGQRTPLPGIRASGGYARLDTATVAGNQCTDWRTRDLAGQTSVVCLTEDGILLRVVQNGRIRAQAVRIDRIAQPDGVFAVPDGFRQAQAPAAPPG